MKKLFHRKKHDDVGSSPSQTSPYSNGNGSRISTSLYDSTPAGGLPQTGDYPIKGNDTANVLKKKSSRRSSIRSWRSSSGSQKPALYNRSPTPDQYGAQGMSSSPPNSNMMVAEPYAPQPGGQNRWSRTQLPQDFSRMNLGNEGESQNALSYSNGILISLISRSSHFDHYNHHYYSWANHHCP